MHCFGLFACFDVSRRKEFLEVKQKRKHLCKSQGRFHSDEVEWQEYFHCIVIIQGFAFLPYIFVWEKKVLESMWSTR